MILDQNTIVLNPANGYYDEYTFDRYSSTAGAKMLPGAVVGQTNVDLIDYYSVNDKARRDECKAKFPFVKYPYDELYDANGNPIAGHPVTSEEKDATQLARYCASKPLNDSRFGAFADRHIHVITAGAPSNITVNEDYLDSVELHILVENALIGKSINHLYFPGEKTPVYTPVQGDRFLVRCCTDVENGYSFKEGEPLYLTNYANAVNGVSGFYFVPAGYAAGPKSNEIKAYAAESFYIPKTTAADIRPFPVYVDAIDDSTTERPSSTPLNGALVNLLRVRIA